MELRQFKYFLKAAETLNFTEAANQVFISQSTLSQQIKQLEIELGAPLFDRIGKRIELTETGRIFRSYAMQAIHSADQGRQIIKELNNIEGGEISIGVTYGLSSMILTTIIKFNQLYPKVKLNMIFGTTTDLLNQLSHLKLDLVCSFLDSSLNNPNLEADLLMESKLMMVVSQSSEIAAKTSVTLKELSLLPMALPDKGYHTRQYLNKTLEEHDLHPIIDIELNDIPTLLKLVETGKWVTVLNKISLIGEKKLVSVPIKDLNKTLKAYTVKMKNIYQPKSVIEFCRLLQSQ